MYQPLYRQLNALYHLTFTTIIARYEDKLHPVLSCE